VSARRSIDVSRLPDVSLDASALFWWGTVGLIAIESMSFAITIGSAIYLRLRVPDWPPPTIPPPDLLPGIAGLALLLASCLPMRAAEQIAGRGRPEEDRRRIAGYLALNLLLAGLFIALRFFEFPGTHTKWNGSAYGSVQWTALGLHLLEGVAGFFETLVLVAVLLTAKVEEKHLLDVRACALFWYFISLVWVPVFAVVYFLPRFR
jgi:heme/copper-type cytochrome/quinol oxidase subunit 3